MDYRFARERPDYSDLASGRVLYSFPGRPALPVRLADELFQRCLTSVEARRPDGLISLYDPCCGAAYHLSVLALLHRERLGSVIASDIDPSAVARARKNLGLATLAGLDARIDEIAQLSDAYGKPSHAEAAASGYRLRERIAADAQTHPLATTAFVADALDGSALRDLLGPGTVDVVVTDVPYGWHSQWRLGAEAGQTADATWRLLDALRSVLRPSGVVAIVSDKRQRALHERYRRVDQFQVGKRRAVILKLAEDTQALTV